MYFFVEYFAEKCNFLQCKYKGKVYHNMLKRKVYSRIEDYLKSPKQKMLIVDGARQIGKSYIIRHLGQKMYPNYIEINMEEDKQGHQPAHLSVEPERRQEPAEAIHE